VGSNDDGWSYFDFDSNPLYWQGDTPQLPNARNAICLLDLAIDNVLNRRDPESTVDLLCRVEHMICALDKDATDNYTLRRNTSEYLEPPTDDE
jgi:hypothetical protein